MEEVIKLTGKPVYFLFRNESNFYTVMRFRLMDGSEKPIIATGTLPEIEMDVIYNIYGKYVEHPRYGMQFQVQSFEKPLPTEEEGIIRYLCGVQFPGIGKKTAEKIVTTLGEDCLELIKEDIHVLDSVPGLSQKNKDVIFEGIQKEQDGMQELVQFLNIHGIGMRNLVRLNHAYGKKALDKLKENPYRVIDECDGFGFKTADKIAMALGFEPDDDRRLYAYLVSLAMDLCMQQGDSYVTEDRLREIFLKKIEPLQCDYEMLLDRALRTGRLVQEEDRIYPESQYRSEEYISRFLSQFPYSFMDEYDPVLLDEYLKSTSEDIGIQYDETQVNAIHEMFNSPLTIVTGGPGTGKTTVVKAMVTLFRLLYPGANILCTAPTGRAAKRLAQVTEQDALTIHSLLKWDLETNTFGVDEREPLTGDLLIIDEFSMVDAFLFYNLLKACGDIKKIVVIGDEDQLPSVSCGSVLRDIIASDEFPVVRLNHIYRQKEGSDVIELAHEIHDGNVNFDLLNHNVAFFECNRVDIKNNIVRIVQNALDKGYEMNDIQVLSPMYGGVAGIDVLNNTLQECFNPSDENLPEIRSGYTTFRLHDKILQLKNQPDDDVFNGDIGEIIDIVDAKHSENHQPCIVARFDDTYVEYYPDNFPNITLAYCISIHKSQGSEYPIVIMPVTFAYSIMLQKKLLYTGCTRARQSLVLLGEKEAFMKGIQNQESHIRMTTLSEKIIESKQSNPFDLD